MAACLERSVVGLATCSFDSSQPFVAVSTESYSRGVGFYFQN
jgi:hypothetical protein